MSNQSKRRLGLGSTFILAVVLSTVIKVGGTSYGYTSFIVNIDSAISWFGHWQLTTWFYGLIHWVLFRVFLGIPLWPVDALLLFSLAIVVFRRQILLIFGAMYQLTIFICKPVLEIIYELLRTIILSSQNISVKKNMIFNWFKKKNDGLLHGISKWRFLNRWNKGLRLSDVAITEIQTRLNTIIWGPMMSGKTISVLCNWLLDLNGSAVVADPARELFSNCSGFQQKVQGKKVFVFNPSQPEISAFFNPIAYVPRFEDGASLLASMIIKHKYGSDSGGDNAFFHSGGKKIIRALVQACANMLNDLPQYATLAQVYDFTNALQIDKKKTMAFICSYLTTHPRIKQEFIATLTGKNEKSVHSFISDAQNALEFFVNKQVATVTSWNTIDFDKMRTTPSVVYLQISEDEMEYYAPLLNIFFAFFFKSILSRTEQEAMKLLPLHFIIEEAGAMGQIDGLQVFINQSRKYNSSVTLVGQDCFSQFTSVYGEKDGKTLLNSVGNHIIFGGLSNDSATFLAKEMGKYTDDDDKKAWKMDVDQIKEIPKYHAVLFSKLNQKPINVGQLATFDTARRLRKRAKFGAAQLIVRKETPPLQFININDLPDLKKHQKDEHQKVFSTPQQEEGPRPTARKEPPTMVAGEEPGITHSEPC